MDVIRSEQTFYDELKRHLVDRRLQNGTMLLESGQQDPYGKHSSWLALEPDIVLLSKGSRSELVIGTNRERRNGNPWNLLRDVRSEYPGWYFGYLGYDLKNFTENLSSSNPDVMSAPDLLFFRPGRVIRLIHETGCLSPWYRRKQKEEIRRNRYCLGPVTFRTDKSVYLDRIQQIQTLIKEGHCYEINLSHALTADFDGDPYQLYRQMADRNAVPFSAYFSYGNISVCSVSPERFLGKSGKKIFSQPIKGTAAKVSNPKRDLELKDQLKNSEKEQAENLMIVDLVRHDLSRVCKPGTVRVPDLFHLHSFETVHQLISTVEGTLNDHVDITDAISSCFPMGSMTGAPKIRSMEIIENLEDYRRGIYSGAIGYITPDNDFDFSVVIRSAIVMDNKVFYPAGGAITSDSVPEKEWEETLIKARSLPGFKFENAKKIVN